VFFFRKKSKPANSGSASYAVVVRDASADDLQAERRADPRQDCVMPAWCAPAAGIELSPWVTLVTDISANGLALSTDRRFEPGTVLVILPPRKDMPGNLLARVIRATPEGVGRWRIGCRLSFPLGEDQVRTLLGTWQLVRKETMPAH
jgi:hypothetical protein